MNSVGPNNGAFDYTIGNEKCMFNDFHLHKKPFSDTPAEEGVAVVVRKRPDFVIMYILELGELCVLLRKYANVRSDAEFDEKYVLAEFYDISFVRVDEQNPQSTIKWMCTEDEFSLNASDWMDARVISGGFVELLVRNCNFIDANLEKLDDDFWIVSTDLGAVLVKKAFIMNQNLYNNAVDLWVTFIKETNGCHWQIFSTDNSQNQKGEPMEEIYSVDNSQNQKGEPMEEIYSVDNSQNRKSELEEDVLSNTNAEEILNAARMNSEIFYLVKLRGIACAELVSSRIASEKYPKLIIDFYEQRMVNPQ